MLQSPIEKSGKIFFVSSSHARGTDSSVSRSRARAYGGELVSESDSVAMRSGLRGDRPQIRTGLEADADGMMGTWERPELLAPASGDGGDRAAAGKP
jgi:hypothetical protein